MTTPEGKAGITFAGTLSILFSDLRDYTAFVEKHGDAAGAALITEYRRLVRAKVAEAGGGEMNTAGDSFYIVFPTARQALQAGMGILREAERYSREHPDRQLRIGIGIHAGEPVPHEGQHVGSAVNIAARLAQQAAAGELLVSDIVRGLLRTSGAPSMHERAAVFLKGIKDPPRVYVVGDEQAPRREAKPRVKPPPTEVAIPAEPPADRRILCPELIGRERELTKLEAFLQEIVAGRGGTVLLAGEAGIGKSAALRAFADRARAAGARMLVGECTEIEARRPFGPFIEIARAAVRDSDQASSQDTGELLGIASQQGSEMALQLPDEAERYRVHAAFARLIADLAQHGAVIVAVEDLHWADEATLELLPYLARKLRNYPVLLLGTYRSDELHRRHPLNHLLAELARGRLAQEVRLHRLTLEETGSVIRAALGLERPPTPEFRAALQERCEGNPFFIEEVLRMLVERGDLSYRDGAWRRTKDVPALAIPVSILDAVQQRLQRLSPDGQRVMQLAAVIGQRFGFELLRRVTGLSEPALLAALRAGVDAQLIGEETANGEEHYVFRHALTRESVAAELLQRERRLMHQAIGEAIEATAGTELAARAEELAYHFDQSRDQERAFRYHELAAREAVRVFAFARAAQHLERAIELASDDDPSLGDLQLRLADAAFQASDIPHARRAAEEARRLFEKAGDARRSGATLRRLSLYRWQLGETGAANELAAEAVRLLEPLGESAELAAAYGELARLAMLDDRNAEAIDRGRRAIEMARQTQALEPLVMALNTVGYATSATSDSAGLALLRESLELALQHDLIFPAHRAYNNLWVSMMRLGAPATELRRVHDEEVEHARRFDFRFDNVTYSMCWYAFSDGDWDQALRLVEEGRGDSILSADRELWGAFIETARHGPERGRALVESPHRRLMAAGEALRTAEASFAVPIMLLAGDFRAALEYAEAVAGLVGQDHWVPAASLATVCSISAAMALRDEAARDRWIELGILRHEALSHALLARHAFARAERSVRNKYRDAAIASFEESARHFSELPVTQFAAHWARLRRAELFLERGAPGDREAAQAEFESVLPYWRKAKATWYLGKLKEWAAERGLRFPES